MATPSVICVSDVAASLLEVAYFDRCALKIINGNNVIESFNMCDYSMNIDEFFSQSVRLKGGESFLIDDAGLGNAFGEIAFLLIQAFYTSGFTKYQDKFINIIYQGNTYPMSEMNIWTGTPNVDTQHRGIIANPNDSEVHSPYFANGGIVLHNPHAWPVDLKILIASSVLTGETSDIKSIVTNQDIGTIFLDNGDYMVP